MNKARRKNNSRNTKRLINDSLILSTTRFVSSRVVRFFEKGIASPVLNSVKTVDHFVRKKVTGPVFKKVELRKNFVMPARNGVASFLNNNRIFNKLSFYRTKIMNSSLRTVGVFLLTFGIYAAAIFMLKRFVTFNIGEADTDDLILSALTVIAGLIFTAFGDKSILTAFSRGRITGSLLSGALGVNDSALNKKPPNKPRTSLGSGFLLGSITGVLTMFFSPISVLSVIIGVVLVVTIFNIPEFGLLLTITALPLVGVEWLYLLSITTMASYLFKCLRLKRNLRFGTADALVLVMFAVMILGCTASGNVVTAGEHYFLCFTAVYFAAKNLLVSEKLIIQAFNALCFGTFIGMLLYILGEFAPLIPYSQLRLGATLISANCLNADMLALLVSAVVPFALASFSSKSSKRSNLLFPLLAVVCAFVSDSLMFYVLLAVSLFVFIACAFKAPMGAVVGSAVVMPLVFTIVADFSQSTAVYPMADLSYDASLAINSLSGKTFWDGLISVGGILSAVIFAAALLFIFQRVFAGAIVANSQAATRVCGTVAASAVMLIASGFMFNIFADLRLILILWFILGLCGAAYKVYYNNQPNYEEV